MRKIKKKIRPNEALDELHFSVYSYAELSIVLVMSLNLRANKKN